MPLQKSIVDIPITGGVETNLYKAVVPPGKSLKSENTRFTKPGSVGAFPASTLEPGSFVAPTALLCDDSSMKRVLIREEYEPVLASQKIVFPPGSYYGDSVVLSSDIAVYGDYAYVLVALPSSYMYNGYIAKVKISTGESSLFASVLYSYKAPARIVISGDYLYAGVSAPGNLLQYRCWSLITGTEITGSPFTVSAGHTFCCGLCSDADATRRASGYIWMAWTNSSGALNVTEITTSTSTLMYTDATIVAESSPAIVAAPSGTRYSFCVGHTAGVKAYVWDSSTGLLNSANLSTSSAAVRTTPAGCSYGTRFYWVFSYAVVGALSFNRFLGGDWIDATTTGSLGQGIVGVVPTSNIIATGGYFYFWSRYTKAYVATGTATPASTQQTEFLIRWDTSKTANNEVMFAIASCAQRDAMTSGTEELYGDVFTPSSIASYDGKYLYTAVTEPQSLISISDITGATVQTGAPLLVSVDFSIPSRNAFSGRRCVVSGGFAHEYDGDKIYESGFLLYPEITKYTPGTGGSLSTSTTYYAKAVFAHVDAVGNKHYSEPSSAIQSATGATDTTITYEVSQYCVGRRPFAIQIYLSTDNINYYLSSERYVETTGATDVVTTVKCWSHSTSSELLYTTGGIAPNGPTRCVTDIAMRGDRFFAVTPDGVLMYSKYLQNGVGVGWSPYILEHDLEKFPGEYWQLSEDNDQLIAIGQTSVQIITGDGADGTGGNSTLSVPSVVSDTDGLLYGSSVVRSKEGSFFHSRNGIKLLTRSLFVEDQLTSPIVDYVEGKTVLYSAKNRHENEIFFLLNDGYMVVYNEDSDAWSYYDVVSSSGPKGIGTGEDGRLCTLGSQLRSINPASLDYTSVQVRIETPWLRVQSLNGRQRMGHMVLQGEYLSDTTIDAEIRYNLDETVVDSFTEDFESPTYSVGDPFVWKRHIGRRCSAIKIALTMYASGVAGALCNLFALTIDLAQKPGLVRMSINHER